MRHRNANRKLNRKSSHRLAMFRNMTNSLLSEETIVTTLPKAKELRKFAEPLITLAKKPNLVNYRLAFSRTRNRQIVMKLFEELGPRFQERPGGYMRILKYGFRNGDNAPLALVQLLSEEEKLSHKAKKLKKKSTGDSEASKTISKSPKASKVTQVKAKSSTPLEEVKQAGDAEQSVQEKNGKAENTAQ